MADSDSEYEDMETDQPKPSKNKKKPSTWIEEDAESIVDFNDPNVISKITGKKHSIKNTPAIFMSTFLATKPGQMPMEQTTEKKKGKGFKTAPDGRLIIKDDDSDDDSDKDKKKGFTSLASDSDSGMLISQFVLFFDFDGFF